MISKKLKEKFNEEDKKIKYGDIVLGSNIRCVHKTYCSICNDTIWPGQNYSNKYKMRERLLLKGKCCRPCSERLTYNGVKVLYSGI